MEGFFYFIGVVLLLMFAFFVIIKQNKEYQEEVLRRETIKNSLCDISESLRNVVSEINDISKGIWYEK